MSVDYILENIQSKGNYELYIPPNVKHHGYFPKGHKPWNKGISWNEMGIPKEKQDAMRKNLEIYQGKGNPKLAGWNSRPVIAIDEYGEQVHWYKSAADAARKLGLIRRNITRACVKGYYCGDFRWNTILDLTKNKFMGYYDRFNKGGKKPKRQRSEKQKWVDKLDRLMSVYIRMRDSREFHYKYFRCISCGRILPIDQADNGHYCGRTHMSLRFDTRNQNAECKRCNRFSSDHLIGYRKNLVMKLGKLAYLQKHSHVPLDMEEVKRLGEQQVDLLEVMKHQAKNWSVFELQELYKYYAALILKMNEERDNQ